MDPNHKTRTGPASPPAVSSRLPAYGAVGAGDARAAAEERIDDAVVPTERVIKPPSRRVCRRSRQQARDTAQRIGGVAQPASGATARHKGDVRKMGVCRIEQKLTTNQKSYRLKREDLDKILGESSFGEVAVLELMFVEPRTYRAQETWAVIPWTDFERLLAAFEASRR